MELRDDSSNLPPTTRKWRLCRGMEPVDGGQGTRRRRWKGTLGLLGNAFPNSKYYLVH
jgi:hypothetical protein